MPPGGRHHNLLWYLVQVMMANWHALMPDVVCSATGCGGPVDCTGTNGTLAERARDNCLKDKLGLHAHDVPLLCSSCTIPIENGNSVAFRSVATAFADAVKLLVAGPGKRKLKQAMDGLRGLSLAETQKQLYELIFEHVAACARTPGEAALIRKHPVPQISEAVLRQLRMLELAGIVRALFITSKCAAGSAIAMMTHTQHSAFLGALASGGVFMFDFALRVGPCRRKSGAHTFGKCCDFSPAETWVGNQARAVLLEALKRVATGPVREVWCFGSDGDLGPKVPHYRYTLATIGDGKPDVRLYKLARSRMLMQWVAEADGHDRASYSDVFSRLIPEQRDRFATVQAYEDAQGGADWEACEDEMYSMPMSLDTNPVLQRARQLLATPVRNANFQATPEGQAHLAKQQRTMQQNADMRSGFASLPI